MARKNKEMEVLSETLGPEIQEDFMPEEPPMDIDAPEEAPEPETFTFKADVLHVFKETVELQVTKADGGAATLIFDKDELSYEGRDVVDLEEGYQGMEFTIPWSLAEEKRLREFVDSIASPAALPETPAGETGKCDDEPMTAPYKKKLREETITVTVTLEPDEREACGQRMADAIKRKSSLEEQLDSYRKSINLQIKSVEKEIEAAADLWQEGQEERRVDCDVIADYNTGEIVWCEKEYPFKERQRQRMTEKDRQLPLPLDAAAPPRTEAPHNAAAAPDGNEPYIVLYGEILEDTPERLVFSERDDPDVDIAIPKEHVVDYAYDDDAPDCVVITHACAVAAGFANDPEQARTEQERSCETCANLYLQPNEGEDDPCFDCGNAEDKPNWRDNGREAEETVLEVA